MSKLRVENFGEEVSIADLRSAFCLAGTIHEIVIHAGEEPPYALVTIDCGYNDLLHLSRYHELGTNVRIRHANRPGNYLFTDYMRS